MKNKIPLYLALIIILVIGVTLILYKNNRYQRDMSKSSQEYEREKISDFYDETLFQMGLQNPNRSDFSSNKRIKGILIPHDTAASFILSDAFEKLSKFEYENIILIGPNHSEFGETPYLTCNCEWETAFGSVVSEYETVNDLLMKSYISDAPSYIETEHSISGIIPYINYYLGTPEIIPIAISGYTTLEEVDFVLSDLREYIEDDTLVIAAVDFSHYLDSTSASSNDEYILGLMDEKKYENLIKLNNDYTDSPQSLILFLKLIDSIETKDRTILYNTNSGEINDDSSIQTTSYFSIVYY